MSHRYVAENFPAKSEYDIAWALRVKLPPREIAFAQTPGGAYRQIFAQYRREIDLGLLNWNRIVVRAVAP